MTPRQLEAWSSSGAEVHTLVRAAFLLRLLTLLASIIGFLNQPLNLVSTLAVIVLACTSLLGLALPSAPAFLQRHPIVAALDGAVMTVVMVVVGTESPLVLLALSSCLLIGIILSPPAATLATSVLVAGYLGASPLADRAWSTFTDTFAMPVTFITMVVLGQVFRLLGERKRQSEIALADLVSGAATAQERARLARELHDSTAKTLQGLALTAQSLPPWIERDPSRAAETAHGIAREAKEAIERLRTLLSTLRQDDLQQPFHQAVAAVTRDLSQRHGVHIETRLDVVDSSAPAVRYELLAATREALVNAATHSGCDRVALSLRLVDDELEVEIRDQGCGFDQSVLADREREGHFGVRGFTERMMAIGGSAEVSSMPGAGTTVLLRAPKMGLREVSA